MTKQSPQVVRKPNGVVYWIAVKLVGFFLRHFYHLTVDKTEIQEIKPPYLVLCNHICNIDFLIAAVAMYPQKMNFVAAALYFKMPALRWLISWMGCISKQQFVSDIQSVRNIVRVVQRGDVPVIFPAGQSSFIGENGFIDPSIAALIRMLKVPVVGVRTMGAHIGFPKWNMTKLRKSRMETTVRVLVSAEDVGRLSDRQIYRQVVDGLAFDDYEWQRTARIADKRPRVAEGVDKALFLCPRCRREFGITAKGSTLTCSHCGFTAHMDEYGLLAPGDGKPLAFDTPTGWYRWELAHYTRQLEDAFAYSEPGTLYRISPHNKRIPVGQITATLTYDTLRLTGICDGKAIDWTVDNRSAPVFPYEAMICFDVMVDGQLYAVAPANPKAAFKFVVIKDAIARKMFEEQA